MIGQRIIEARKRAGMTQWELAQAAAVPLDWLKRWEYALATPRSSHLIQLAHALNVSVDCFLRPPDDEWTLTGWQQGER